MARPWQLRKALLESPAAAQGSFAEAVHLRLASSGVASPPDVASSGRMGFRLFVMRFVLAATGVLN